MPLPLDTLTRYAWKEIMDTPVFIDEVEDWCHVQHCIEEGLVRGLADILEGVERRGELVVKDKAGIVHVFNITAAHKYPIPEDTYMLLSTGGLRSWDYFRWT